MRAIVITLAFAALCSPAAASSIEQATMGNLSNDSIVIQKCTTCPALKPKVKSTSTYSVKDIPQGTESVEIRDVNGVRKIFRTEAFSGGSPVLFVTKAPPGVVEDAVAATKPTLVDKAVGALSDVADMAIPPAIDSETTTSSLDNIDRVDTPLAAGMGGDGAKAEIKPLDMSKFELRLN